jgi:uncharacterized membrane protein YesL
MEQSKKTSRWIKTKSSFRENWKIALLFVTIPVLLVVALQVSQFFGSIAVTKESMLSTLIQAEATILGFFGLVAVYALTSFDNRADKLDERLFKLTTEEHPQIKKQMLELEISRLKENRDMIQKNKKNFVNSALGTGFFLFLSLILSIFSFAQVPFASSLATGAIYFLFAGIVHIFMIFNNLAKI